MSFVARTASVSWDARAALDATVDDLSETMVREHLRACGNALLGEADPRTMYRKMDIVRRVNDHEVPRNVALLFFSRDPARWFPGARIEVAILRSGTGGDVIEEKEFGGGLAEQVGGCLAYLRREVIGLEINKAPNGMKASRRSNYPEEALREVLVNALYHRSYDRDSPHTTLVRVTSDRIDVRSTPGPVPGIDRAQLRRGATPRLVPPRNPRIGELFKETGLAEKRLTGRSRPARGRGFTGCGRRVAWPGPRRGLARSLGRRRAGRPRAPFSEGTRRKAVRRRGDRRGDRCQAAEGGRHGRQVF